MVPPASLFAIMSSFVAVGYDLLGNKGADPDANIKTTNTGLNTLFIIALRVHVSILAEQKKPLWRRFVRIVKVCHISYLWEVLRAVNSPCKRFNGGEDKVIDDELETPGRSGPFRESSI